MRAALRDSSGAVREDRLWQRHADMAKLGGTPKGGHVNKGPGEWLAAGAVGSKSIMMMKGDMLVIPRGTLHKRSTEDSVTFILISTPGVVKT